jgi:RNA 2',3'-cyclic 3'-phosphodiesterase
MSDTARIRLFFALPAPGAALPLLQVRERLAAYGRLLKAVAPGQYHITLKFLGETDTGTCRRLREDFRAYDPGIGEQPFTLRGLGAFPNIRHPRVLWCGLDLDRDPVARVQRSIEELAARHGFPVESRPFAPHLTLARVRGEGAAPGELCRFLDENRVTAYGESRFDRIVLYRSELGKEGPAYTALEEIRLV